MRRVKLSPRRRFLSQRLPVARRMKNLRRTPKAIPLSFDPL